MIGKVIGEYKVLGEIGRGGMGIVYLAEHLHLRQTYALKILPEELSQDESFIQHFYTEARTMASLKHPGIVQVVYMGKDGDLYYLVMEHVVSDSGKPKNLQELIGERGGKLSHLVLKPCLEQICAALDYAHSFRSKQIKEGVVHRDLKPSNILLGRNDRMKLSDFGLAKVLGDDFMRSRIEKSMRTVPDDKPPHLDVTITLSDFPPATTEAIMGTYEYMSPEQKAGGKIDHRSDIFSLGVIIYSILTGRKPVGRFKNPSEFDNAIPKMWDSIIERCLQESPDDRFQTVGEIAAILEGKGAARKRSPLLPALTAAGVAVILAGGLSYAWWFRASRPAEEVPPEFREMEVEVPVAEGPPPETVVDAAGADAGAGDEAAAELARENATEEAAERKYNEWYDRGIEKMLAGDREQASIAFNRALEYREEKQARDQIASIKHDTYLEEARSLAGKGKYSPSIEFYEKALAERRTAEVEDELKKAREELKKEMSEKKRDELYRAYLAKAREMDARSQFKQAISSYQAALKYNPEDAEIEGHITRLRRMAVPIAPGTSLIPAGEFRMGSDSPATKGNERPAHMVYLDEYYIDQYEITNKEYERFDPAHRGERVGGDNDPATKVSWEDAMAYCAWRAAREGLPEGTYRLPTEAEWERASSAGSRSAAGGVVNIPGSAWEWCSDWYDEHYYTSCVGREKNPMGPSWGSTRSVRDVAWGDMNRGARVTSRMGLNPSAKDIKTLGFRCVRVK